MGTMKIKNREKWDFLLLTELRSQLGAIKNWGKDFVLVVDWFLINLFFIKKKILF